MSVPGGPRVPDPSVTRPDLESMAAQLWDAFVGVAATPEPARPHEGAVYTACVDITGDWDGTVSLALPDELARSSAAAMLGVEEDAMDDADVVDAIGELANVVGGSITGAIDGPCRLSLPVVATGSDHPLAVPGTEVLESVTLATGDQQFHVTLRRRLA